MGIECDGATYHSAKSTRDRDRLRQEILEGLGWRIRRIRRIWSTDWFKHPKVQLEPILRELEELRK
jgi:very-short-patch-repair endonuclease